jgi:hypothetical protein
MSTYITESFVLEFGANVYHLAQQKGSRFRAFTRQETFTGKAKAFDRIGAVDAVEKTGRHSNTPQMDTPQSRRWVYLRDYEWADLVDQQDKIRTLNDPTNDYVMAAMWAMGRRFDDTIISAFTATAVTGENFDGTATLATSQRCAAVASSALSNLNVGALINIKSKYGSNDVDEELPVHITVAQSQLDALLADDQITSGDYNTVKALVKGEINQYMGMTFHRSQRLGTESGAPTYSVTTGQYNGGGSSVNGERMCVAWTPDSIISGVGQDMISRVSERDDKSYATQVYVSMSIGAVRMEEVKVVVCYCKE